MLLKPLSFLVCATFAASMAQADDLDLFSLSLNELMTLDITTVSKREESLVDAAGIVSVITKDEIKTYGSKSLKDVLLRIPNFYLFDSPTFKSSGMMLRAGATQHLNNHVLFLLDGRPFRESQNGGLHSDITSLFPVESIERIEVIRGPGSVLYGSNAFSGTINIISKTVEQSPEVKLQSKQGSDGYSAHVVSAAGAVSEKISMHLTATTLNYDGETLSAIDESGASGSQAMSKDGELLHFRTDGYGANISILLDEINTAALTGANNWDNKANFKYERTFYDIGYQTEFAKNWQVSGNYTVNKQRRIVTGPGSSVSEFEADGYLTELTINGEISPHTNLISGAVYDVIKGDLDTRGGQYETHRQALFTQLDHSLNTATKLTAGVQWNKPKGADSDISPRIALVHHHSHIWSSKLLYAKAFRSPYGSELFFDSAFLNGDENLKSESIQTTEAQLIYAKKNLSLTFTLYQSVAQDLIGRAIVNSVNTFVNEPEEIEYYGYEMEWNWQINKNMRLQGNASYQENSNEAGEDDVMVGANEMFKVGYAYHSQSGLTLGIWNNYLGAANKLENLSGNSTSVVNPKSESVNLLSLNIVQNIGRLLKKSKLEPLTLELLATNILDEEVWYPELGRRLVNTFPQTHETGFFATIKYEF